MCRSIEEDEEEPSEYEAEDDEPAGGRLQSLRHQLHRHHGEHDAGRAVQREVEQLLRDRYPLGKQPTAEDADRRQRRERQRRPHRKLGITSLVKRRRRAGS